MINDKLINPDSIVVIGGSDDVTKPGGKILKNIIKGNYTGKIYIVNPNKDFIQGIKCYRDVALLPHCDLAILAIPANLCLQVVEILASKKSTRAFIIISAGFGEESLDGKILERQIVDLINRYQGCLIGPNCIGIINANYKGVFTDPVPSLNQGGVDFISGSGATAVFIMEAAIPNGLPFASIVSVGNGAQTGVEDYLEYLDNSYIPGVSPHIKLLYMESIEKPDKLFKHASSLISKGCRIAAIKAGSSDAGSRAASSHTGALAGSDIAADALLHKAGIIRCHSRTELIAVASVFMHPLPKGRRIGIITHAGGPAVMMTDALSKGGLQVPAISGREAEGLLRKLHPGSSVTNPIDFLATGTGEQLGYIIDACENDFENIDAMVVIFGSPGLLPVSGVYDLLGQKMGICRKPIFPVLPSLINARSEIDKFILKGFVNFPDEVVFAEALSKVMNAPAPEAGDYKTFSIDYKAVRNIIRNSPGGYLETEPAQAVLEAAGIPFTHQIVVQTLEDALNRAEEAGYPVVMKIAGPVHKSESGGVALNITCKSEAVKEFSRISRIPGSKGVIVQKMIRGTELFAGAKAEGSFGHIIMAGLGGIFVEVFRDVTSGLVPLSETSALTMIRSLKSYEIIRGIRGQKGINEKLFADILCRLSALIEAAPEISEMDLNPLIGDGNTVVAVDARICIGKHLSDSDTISKIAGTKL